MEVSLCTFMEQNRVEVHATHVLTCRHVCHLLLFYFLPPCRTTHHMLCCSEKFNFKRKNNSNNFSLESNIFIKCVFPGTCHCLIPYKLNISSIKISIKHYFIKRSLGVSKVHIMQQHADDNVDCSSNFFSSNNLAFNELRCRLHSLHFLLVIVNLPQKFYWLSFYTSYLRYSSKLSLICKSNSIDDCFSINLKRSSILIDND